MAFGVPFDSMEKTVMKFFLSYSSDDSELAGQIKTTLEDMFGVDVFLAHDDIQPSSEWQREILSTLEQADVFIPILTESFEVSDYTDQETGYALARGIFVIPIKIKAIPHGFISHIQALKFQAESPQGSCQTIARAVVRNPKLRKSFLDDLIKNFGGSYSFDRAKAMSAGLMSLDGYTRQQKNEIIRLATDNAQIYGSFGAKKNLERFIKDNKSSIDSALVDVYEQLIKDR
jgi:nucleoside 2-deoxyribosyltransferase